MKFCFFFGKLTTWHLSPFSFQSAMMINANIFSIIKNTFLAVLNIRKSFFFWLEKKKLGKYLWGGK
jgi:hypothetical protein